MYIAIPVLLYVGERIFRAIRSGLYEVEILKVYIVVLFGRKLGTKVHNFGNCSMQSAMNYCFFFLSQLLNHHYVVFIFSFSYTYAGKYLSRKSFVPQIAKTRRF